MPRGSYSAVVATATDAEWRASFQQLSNLLKSVLTQTADTGQIDWARGVTIGDDFNRADGAVGGIWTVAQGTANVESNKLRMLGTPNGAFILTSTGAGNSHGTIRVTIGSTGADGQPSLVWRAASLVTFSSGFIWNPTAGTVQTMSALNTLSTMATHTPITLAPGDVIEVEFHGNAGGTSNHEWYCRRNGVLIASGSNVGGSSNSNANYHGIRTTSHATGALLEDFGFIAPLKQYTLGTIAGYEIYRFSDALQSTKPVFIKVEYGSSTSAATVMVKISVGTATNGAGTLSGLTNAPVTAARTALSGASGDTYACYKDGTFTLAWNVNTGSTQTHLIAGVTRTKDANGNSTNNGLMAIHIGPANANAPNVAVWSFDLNYVAVTTAFAGIPCIMPPGASSGTDPLVNLYNWFCQVPDIYNVTGWFSYKTGEISMMSQVDVAVVGSTSRHYVCLGVQQDGGWSSTGQIATDALAILWEV